MIVASRSKLELGVASMKPPHCVGRTVPVIAAANLTKTTPRRGIDLIACEVNRTHRRGPNARQHASEHGRQGRTPCTTFF